MTANINLDRSKFGLKSISDKIIGYDIAEASSQTKEEDYNSAIFYLAPICDKARKAGKESRLSDSILKQYYPFPKKYFSFVIENLPKEIKALPPQEIESFIISFFSYIHRESKFDPGLVNQKSQASGLTQLLPSTAKGVAKELGLKHYDLLDPYDNMKLGMNYFASLWLEHGGIKNKTLIMACWNYGSGNTSESMRHHKGKPLIVSLPQETKQFIKDVNYNSAMYRHLFGQKIHYLAFAVSNNRVVVHIAKVHEHKPVIHMVKQVNFMIKVQLGSLPTFDKAVRFREQHMLHSANIEKVVVNGNVWFRVNIAFKDWEKAEKYLVEIKKRIPDAWKSS